MAGNPITADQRGKAKPADGDADCVNKCDMGAFELQDGPCPRGMPPRIVNFKLAKSDPHIAFQWTLYCEAQGGFNLFQTDTRAEVSSLRLENSFTPFLHAEPNEALPFVYTDGMINGLAYYQVLGVCIDTQTEGEN